MSNNSSYLMAKFAYVGNDRDSIQDFHERFQKDNSWNVKSINKSYYPGVFLSLAHEELPNVIVFEVPTTASSILHEEICFLKRNLQFKPIMLIALFPDKESLEGSRTLLTCGVSLCYLIGCEYEHLYRDSILYGLEKSIPVPSFAKAKDLRINRKMNIISTISGVTSDELFVAADIEVHSASTLKFSLNFIDDFKPREFEILEHREGPFILPMLDIYKLKIPYAGPWDEESENTIDKDNITDFLDSYENEFESRKDFVWVISNTHLIEKIFLYSLTSPFIIEHLSLTQCTLFETLKSKLPVVIFIELNDRSQNDYSWLISLIENIRSIGEYNPIIIVFNTQESTHNFRVTNNYENIIFSTKQFEFDFFSNVIAKLAAKNTASALQFSTFKKDDKKRIINLELDISIKSLTEHEIEFVTTAELALFSLAQISLPENILITIVHSTKQGEEKWRYIGILHGIDVYGYQTLRKVVNQLIFDPRLQLTDEDIRKILLPPSATDVVPTEAIISTSINDESRLMKAKNNNVIIRSQRVGKSKL